MHDESGSPRVVGARAEALAVDCLTRAGYDILCRNYATRYGEIDIVAWDRARDTLAFVEVKYRSRQDYGRASEAVSHTKQQRIIRSAQVYLKRQPRRFSAYRFDVLAIAPSGSVEHIPNAFGLATEF